MKRFHSFVFAFALWLIRITLMVPVVLAGGKVEHHQMTSKILADGGEVMVWCP